MHAQICEKHKGWLLQGGCLMRPAVHAFSGARAFIQKLLKTCPSESGRNTKSLRRSHSSLPENFGERDSLRGK
eukprot:1158418-Pelagomonas_calceolata.AAC.16